MIKYIFAVTLSSMRSHQHVRQGTYKTLKSDFIACSTYLLTIVTGPMSHEPTPVDPDNMILNTNKKNKKKKKNNRHNEHNKTCGKQ